MCTPEYHPSPRFMADEVLERAVLATPSSVGLLRDLAEAHLNKWGLAPVVDDATLVISELLTNAVKAKPRHLMGFRLMRWRAVLYVEVFDESAEDAVPTDPTGDLLENGRGLHIVAALSRHWGQRREPGGGKTVYALLDLPG
ncbi:ATP-binding protein [Actinomadura kijaniata]|uniref:ATP-binding protein n=1 Tax=Actinomadura kijaniata TaxID=46161 RepID=UPI003F1E362F